jgi:hypothetical protein
MPKPLSCEATTRVHMQVAPMAPEMSVADPGASEPQIFQRVPGIEVQPGGAIRQ